jgi:hypothetical protein
LSKIVPNEYLVIEMSKKVGLWLNAA